MITIMWTWHLEALEPLVSRELQLRPGQTLFRAGDAVRQVYLVREGEVQLVRYQREGQPLVLQTARPGQLLAEASLFSQRYHCDAIAPHKARLGCVPRHALQALQQEDPRWITSFAGHLAAEVQRARARAELLSLKRVDERLEAWLALNDGALPERGRWKDLAAELAVSTEALYRELARRRSAGAAPTRARQDNSSRPPTGAVRQR